MLISLILYNILDIYCFHIKTSRKDIIPFKNMETLDNITVSNLYIPCTLYENFSERSYQFIVFLLILKQTNICKSVLSTCSFFIFVKVLENSSKVILERLRTKIFKKTFVVTKLFNQHLSDSVGTIRY